jgi:hypothetical protein
MITSHRKLAQVLDNRITQTRMNDQFNKPNANHGSAMPDRRKFLSGAAAMKRLANQFDLLISSPFDLRALERSYGSETNGITPEIRI